MLTDIMKYRTISCALLFALGSVLRPSVPEALAQPTAPARLDARHDAPAGSVGHPNRLRLCRRHLGRGQGGRRGRAASSPKGEESFPRFSPDGSLLAFTGDYDGNEDIYVMPADGGLPQRLTHHGAPDRMLDWYPDGKSILYATSMTSPKNRFNQLYKVSAQGGLPEKLPVPYGEFGAISPDGKTLAYVPISVDFRTWKRYRGGMNPDIWLFDLDKLTARNLTRSPAADSVPMWHGESTLSPAPPSVPFGDTRAVTYSINLAQVPDPLAKQVEELARQEKVSVDQLVSIALAYQVSAWRKRDTISERGKRGNWEKFDRVMAKVRDVPPLPGDEK